MAFLRFTRDRRGYENTFLLHVPRPGDRPRVLYWYRSAPGVRVGRPALDEDAIRTIEEQHPNVDFDWPHILEVGAVTEPEVEQRRPERPKRRQPPPTDAQPRVDDSARPSDEPARDDTAGASVEEPELAQALSDLSEESEGLSDEPPPTTRSRSHDLLEELVGHEIATRLHARYSEILGRVHRMPADNLHRAVFQARAEALNPDNWVTPDEVLRGVQHADALFDSLRRELLAN